MSKQNQIESRSIDILKNELHKCKTIETHFSENDRGISWDGFIYLFKKEDCNKKDFEERIPVQIKGTLKELSDETTTFNVDIDDLKNYEKDGGCIFFYIFVKSDYIEGNIYYASLLPIDLNKLLSNVKVSQKNCSINLKRLPKDSKLILQILENFVDNKRLQYNYKNKIYLKDVKETANYVEHIDYFEFRPVDISQKRLPNKAELKNRQEFYAYAVNKGRRIRIPIEDTSGLVLTQKVNIPFYVGKEKIDDIAIQNKDGCISLILGHNIVFTTNQTYRKFKLDFKPEEKLINVIEDYCLLIKILENKGFKIDKQSFIFNKIKLVNKELTKLKNILDYHEQIQKTLDCLDVTEDLILNNLNEKDWNILNCLIDGILKKEAIMLESPTSNIVVGPVAVGNLSIDILGIKQSNNKYIIKSLTKADEEIKDNELTAPLTFALGRASFKHSSNLDFSILPSQLKKFHFSQKLSCIVNTCALEFIAAYDEKPKDELLKIAMRLFDWLLQYCNETDEPIYKLNKIQCSKRLNKKLSADEIILLGSYIDDNSKQPANVRCGAYILLEKYNEAKTELNKLPLDKQNEFKTYPIWKLLT